MSWDDWEDRDQFAKHLRKLLLEQERDVRRIQSIAARKSIKIVPSIRLPKLHPLLIHGLEGKEVTLKLCLDTLDSMKAAERITEVRELIEEEGLPWAQYPSEADFGGSDTFLDKAELRKAKAQLNNISELNEKLRRFLANHFTIEDLA